ncbi:IS21 family transposase [Streptomyces sp. NPDC002851]
MIEPFKPVIDAWLRADITLKGTVIHERLVDQYGFTGNYQRVKLYLHQARPRVMDELGISPDELDGLHRRFEVFPGVQAQVDWGDEGGILARVGIKKAYSFHMVLSYSRDPFCCFTTSMDLATFWDCHRRAFAHFGGVPKTIVYDRTKTVVRRHVAPGEAVPLHPEAVAFAGHYNFDIDVLAAYRPQGKGRVERQVTIDRDHVLAGRPFGSVIELDAAFVNWVPLRRARVHRTHLEVIGLRAERDHAALRPLPKRPYLVADRHLRHVSKDCLVAFEASLYSVPARRVRPRQLVEVRVGGDTASLHLLAPDLSGSTLLAVHPRAHARGTWTSLTRTACLMARAVAPPRRFPTSPSGPAGHRVRSGSAVEGGDGRFPGLLRPCPETVRGAVAAQGLPLFRGDNRVDLDVVQRVGGAVWLLAGLGGAALPHLGELVDHRCAPLATTFEDRRGSGSAPQS